MKKINKKYGMNFEQTDKRISGKMPRLKWHCTICAEPLPYHKKDWALVWDDEITGACVSCVESIRERIKKS